MSELHLYKLIIDDDFKKIMPPLTTEEYTDLEENIVYRGCKEPVVVWNRIIVDGLHRYEMCHRWNIPFPLKEVTMLSREEAIITICKNTLSRNITDEQFRYCIGRLYAALKIYMNVLYPHQNQYTPSELRRPGNIDTSRSRTATMVTAEYPMSTGTVAKYGNYAKAVDEIDAKVPQITSEILSGDFHLSHENTVELSRMSPDEISVIYNHVKNQNDEHLLYSEMRRCKEKRKKQPIAKESKTIKRPEIKQMPKYDPDAELSSLTLTIPTWISCMKRTLSMANFNQASTEALWKLEQQFKNLKNTIEILQNAIEEEYHE